LQAEVFCDAFGASTRLAPSTLDLAPPTSTPGSGYV